MLMQTHQIRIWKLVACISFGKRGFRNSYFEWEHHLGACNILCHSSKSGVFTCLQYFTSWPRKVFEWDCSVIVSRRQRKWEVNDAIWLSEPIRAGQGLCWAEGLRGSGEEARPTTADWAEHWPCHHPCPTVHSQLAYQSVASARH